MWVRIPLREEIQKMQTKKPNFSIVGVECSDIYKTILICTYCDCIILHYVKYDPIQYNIKH